MSSQWFSFGSSYAERRQGIASESSPDYLATTNVHPPSWQEFLHIGTGHSFGSIVNAFGKNLSHKLCIKFSTSVVSGFALVM